MTVHIGFAVSSASKLAVPSDDAENKLRPNSSKASNPSLMFVETRPRPDRSTRNGSVSVRMVEPTSRSVGGRVA